MRWAIPTLLALLILLAPAASAGGMAVSAIAYPEGGFEDDGVPSDIVVLIEGPSEGVFRVTLLEDGHAVAEKEVGANPSGKTIVLLWAGPVSWGDELVVEVKHVSSCGVVEKEAPVNLGEVEKILSKYRPIPSAYFALIILLSGINSAAFLLAARRRGLDLDILPPAGLFALLLFFVTVTFGHPLSEQPRLSAFLCFVSLAVPAGAAIYLYSEKFPLLAAPVASQGAVLLAATLLAQEYVIPSSTPLSAIYQLLILAFFCAALASIDLDP